MNCFKSFFYKLYLFIFKKKKSIHDGVFYINGSDTLPPPLSKEEEAKAFAELAEDSSGAREKLIVHNLRLVVYIAKKFESTGTGVEDLISIGTIGLIKAVNTFRPDKKIKLATYASRCIENEILMYLRRNNKTRLEVSIDEPLNVDWDGNELLLSDILGTDEDVIYKDNTETRSTALLDKGRYVCTKRFNSVIGKTSPSFLEKLLRLIPLTFDFTDCLSSNSISTEKDACNVSVSENPSDTVESAVTVVPEVTITSEDNTITSEVEQKLGKEESAMLEVIGFALDKLDHSKPFKEQLDSFLADIDLEATELIKQVFFIACNVEKITYGYIINELEHDFCFSKGKNNSTKIVKETFKCWLEKHPDLAGQYPKISIMPMLKLFAKKFA